MVAAENQRSGHLLTAERQLASLAVHPASCSSHGAAATLRPIYSTPRCGGAPVWATFSTVLPPLTAGRRGMAHSRAEVVLDREGDLCRELRSQSAEGVGDPDAAPQE